MAYKIIIENNKSDKASVNYLLQNYSELRVANRVLKEKVMEIFGIDQKYKLAFDMVRIKGLKRGEDEIKVGKKAITLIKLKTTARYLPESPKGFVFVAGDDMRLAKRLKNFEFCFVCLNRQSRQATFVNLDELNQLIKNKRIKYEINL